MSSAAKLTFLATRIPGFTGRGDKYLGEIAQDLRRVLWKTQNTFAEQTCRLPDAAWSDVAVLLVEWAEDIHNDLGLWRTLEDHQRRCFDTPLPMVGVPIGATLSGFDPLRIQYFLWNCWLFFNRDLVLSPTHPDLRRLADTASRFLTERMGPVPRDSGLKHFLATSNTFGWDIKRKLLWLGINSYLFRFFFFQYLDDTQRKPDITTKDDFVCALCTEWAGLGVIDVLAGALDLQEEDRATLRTWHDRHLSFFRVLERQEERGEVKCIIARNMVNGQPYTIRMNATECPFQPGMVVYGSVTPWRGEWYWSGTQETFAGMPEHEEANIRQEMLAKSSAIAYRYCPAEAEKARELTRQFHTRFVAHYGAEFVSFPDGLAMAAAEQQRMEAEWMAADPEKVARAMGEHGLERPRPRMNFPPEILKHDQGIGLFSNPEEGQELMLRFNHVLCGLRKHGDGLTSDELQAIRGLVISRRVSTAFVRRLAAKYGAESIAAAFLLTDGPPELALDFLLRRHKGHYFRKRYPTVSVFQDAPQTTE